MISESFGNGKALRLLAFRSLSRSASSPRSPAATIKRNRSSAVRLLTAYILVLRDTYNQVRKTGPGVTLKAEPMDAERSKKIMLALAEGDWSDKESGANAGNALNWLRHSPLVTPKAFPSGTVAIDDKEAIAKAQQWLKEHAETHRLQRLILVEAVKK
jgi:hypothetical protein